MLGYFLSFFLLNSLYADDRYKCITDVLESVFIPTNKNFHNFNSTKNISRTRKEIALKNRELVDELEKINLESIAATSGRPQKEMDKAFLDELYKNVSTNKVSSLDSLEKYAGKNISDFCFGRAMAAHLYALKMGVKKEAILKVIALGNLEEKGVSWNFHIATLVRSKDNWFAIDPEMRKAITLREWAKEMERYNEDESMALYLSAPDRFSAIGRYKNSTLMDPRFNKYFIDLLKTFKETGVCPK